MLSRLSGELAHAPVIASAAMAAIVGDFMGIFVTLGTVALPEMRKYRYHDGLSTDVMASGSTLGPLILPSMTFIVYGLLTQPGHKRRQECHFALFAFEGEKWR